MVENQYKMADEEKKESKEKDLGFHEGQVQGQWWQLLAASAFSSLSLRLGGDRTVPSSYR